MKRRVGRQFRVRLELARQLGHSRGDPQTGYEMTLPLDPAGRIDSTFWLDDPLACKVARFRSGGDTRSGVLARSPAGRWYFEFGDAGPVDHRGLVEDRFVPGHLVGVVEEDAELRTYRVASVEPVAAAAPA